jgi:hypothetical protein
MRLFLLILYFLKKLPYMAMACIQPLKRREKMKRITRMLAAMMLITAGNASAMTPSAAPDVIRFLTQNIAPDATPDEINTMAQTIANTPTADMAPEMAQDLAQAMIQFLVQSMAPDAAPDAINTMLQIMAQATTLGEIDTAYPGIVLACMPGLALTDMTCLNPGHHIVCNNWPDILHAMETFIFSRGAGPEGVLVIFDYDFTLCEHGQLLYEAIPDAIHTLRNSGISVIQETAAVSDMLDVHALRIEEMNDLGIEFSPGKFGRNGVIVGKIYLRSEEDSSPEREHLIIYKLDNANGVIYTRCDNPTLRGVFRTMSKKGDIDVKQVRRALLRDSAGSFAPKGDIIVSMIRSGFLERPTQVVFVDDQIAEIASFDALRELGIPVLCILNTIVRDR